MNLLKWIGTILCLIGIFLTSFNIYPDNLFFGLVGSGLWTIAGWIQRDSALFAVEVVAVAFYVSGIANWIKQII